MIVDGYNIIGAWPELIDLKRENLELARNRLVEILKEFQVYTGTQVILVFDGYLTAAPRENTNPNLVKDLRLWIKTSGQGKPKKLQVLFSKHQETADELIERIVYEMEKQGAHIYVATSDRVEQQITFGEGALRISANELSQRVKQVQTSIQHDVRELANKRNTLADQLDGKVAEIFEKWRRKT